MKITLERQEGIRFEAKSGLGHTVVLDGPPKIGGTDSGVRPMEMLLMSLAGCSAVDVVMILDKGRQPLGELTVEVEGTRRDAIPATFEDIHLAFHATGIPLDKLERAVRLSIEKYCSVAHMIRSVTNIRWTCTVS
jgi:putative redox protein